jgi:hypothetical protein
MPAHCLPPAGAACARLSPAGCARGVQVLLMVAGYLAVRYRRRAQERIADQLRLRADKRQRAAAAEGGAAAGGASGLQRQIMLPRG